MQNSGIQDSQTAEDRLLGPLLETWLDQIKQLAANQIVKVFITYAWPKRGEEEGIHDFLKRLRKHLMRAGVEVWLDHYTMGNNPGTSPEAEMRKGIVQANVILMIGTETYQQRSAQNTNVKLEVDCIKTELDKGPSRSLKIYPLLYRGDFGSSFPKAIYPNGPQDMVMDCREGQAAYDYYKHTLPSLVITLLGRSEALKTAYEKHEQAIIKRREELVPRTFEGAKFHLQKKNEENAEITLLFGGIWRLNDQGRYVNLAILEEHIQKTQEKMERDDNRLGELSSSSSSSFSSSSRQKEKDKANTEKNPNTLREQHLASFETIYAVKRTVELKKLWGTKQQAPGKPVDDKAPNANFLMALGRAGVGKSTCCKYIALMHQQLWPGKFDFVFLIPWRTLTTTLGFYAGMSLSEVLYHHWAKGQGITTTEWEALYKKIAAQPDKVLLLLDGYDELTPQQLGITTSLEQAPIVQGLVNALFHKIITSRPYGVENLRPQARLEIIGFTDDNIKTYIDHYFDNSATAKEAYDFMYANPSIWGVTHIPVTLELLCGTWQENKAQLNDDFTLTRLYHSILTSLLRRYLDNRQREGDKALQDVGAIHELTIPRVWALSEQMLLFLSELAKTGLASGKLVIDPSLIDRCRHGKPDNILRDALVSGLLKGTSSDKNATKQAVYFVHLTFQEFFAAYALISPLITNEVNSQSLTAQALKAIQYAPRYQVVVWFCAGLWDLPSELSPWKSPADRDRFWQVLLQPPREITLVYDASLLVRCIEESAQTRKVAKPPKYYKEAIAFVTMLMQSFAKKPRVLPEGLIRALNLCPHFMANHGLTAQLKIYNYKHEEWTGTHVFTSDETLERTRTVLLTTWSMLEAGLRRCLNQLLPVILGTSTCVVQYYGAMYRDYRLMKHSVTTLYSLTSEIDTNERNPAFEALLQVLEYRKGSGWISFPDISSGSISFSDKESLEAAVTALCEIFPKLSSNQYNKALEVLLHYSYHTCSHHDDPASKVFNRAFSELNADQRNQVLEILRQVTSDSNSWKYEFGCKAMAELTPHLDAAQHDQALQILLNIAKNESPFPHKVNYAIKALSLLPQLDNNQRDQVFQTLIHMIKNKKSNVTALSLLVPQLDTNQLTEAFEVVIQAHQNYGPYHNPETNVSTLGLLASRFDPTTDQCSKAAKIFLKIFLDIHGIDVHKAAAATAFSSLAPKLDASQRNEALAPFLEIVLAEQPAGEELKHACEMLGVLVPCLDAIQIGNVLKRVEQATRDQSSYYLEYFLSILGYLAPQLDAVQRNLGLKILKQTFKNSKSGIFESNIFKQITRKATIEALGKLTPYLDTNQRQEALEIFKNAAKDPDERHVRKPLPKILSALAPQVDTEERGQIFEILKQAARDTESDVRVAAVEAIGLIILHLDASQRDQALNIIGEVTHDSNYWVQKSVSESLQPFSLEKVIVYHLQASISNQALENWLVGAVWRSHSALVINSGQISLQQPQDLTVNSHPVPKGFAEFFQGRVRALEAAFRNEAGL